MPAESRALTVLIPLASRSAVCKCCGKPADLFGVVDFHKSCEDRRGPPLPLSGVPIYYYRCPNCGFLFTTAFDDAGNRANRNQLVVRRSSQRPRFPLYRSRDDCSSRGGESRARFVQHGPARNVSNVAFLGCASGRRGAKLIQQLLGLLPEPLD